MKRGELDLAELEVEDSTREYIIVECDKDDSASVAVPNVPTWLDKPSACDRGLQSEDDVISNEGKLAILQAGQKAVGLL